MESLEFDEKWQQLKGRFKDRLVIRFTDIDVAWQALDRDAGDLAALSALFHLVHSLAGSGATFGFERLSERARDLEPTLDPQLEAGRLPVVGARRERIAVGLELIRSEAHLINEMVRAVN